jgi:lysophospholipid acyltransferase (LPLAT)-like uncharacterized protein
MTAPEIQNKVSEPGDGARKTPAVIIPHALRWHQRLAASVIYGLIEAISFTHRYRWEYHGDLLKKDTGPFICCIWHNRLPLSLIMYRHYVRQKKQKYQLAAMVSASKDGGVVARILEHFGVQPVRGSSSRRGPQALLELTTWAERGYDLAITPDGPRGPRYEFQPGALALAQLTGKPLVPVSYHLNWKICLRSWDRFQIPLPFSRVVMKFGEPFRVPREATEEQREILRQEFERRLRDLTVD